MKKPTKKEIIFDNSGDFNAIRAAERYLSDKGYDYGSLDVPNPVAFVRGDYSNHYLKLPWKWHNMSNKQKNNVDGVITGDFRNGPVKVSIFE